MIDLWSFFYVNRQLIVFAVSCIIVFILSILKFRKMGLVGLKHEINKEISEMKNIPEHNLDDILETLKKATYPASLGSLNMLFYQFALNQKTLYFNSPEIFFLAASFLFFFASILVGITYEPPNLKVDNQSKKRVTFTIFFCFILAIGMDFTGVSVLSAILLMG